jgi:hypothetical protein
MNCLEFRRAAGADPQHLTSEAQAHARECPACARYLAEVLELDARIARALAVPIPERGAGGSASLPGHMRRRVFALAASVLLAIGVGVTGWLVLSPSSLAADVVEHMRDEPQAWRSTTPASDAALEAAMRQGGARFATMPGRIMYVQSCLFRGHRVPHLVLETDTGPVTLMLLRHESVRTRKNFNEEGYQGVLIPVGKGSIAVLTHGTPLSAELATRIAGLLEWTS